MWSYFKPLRRKLGAVTLLLACVCATGWVRSSTYDDGFDQTLSQSRYGISSVRGKIRAYFARSEHARVLKMGHQFWSYKLDPNQKTDLDVEKESSGLNLGNFRLLRSNQDWGHYSELVQTAGPAVPVTLFDVQLPYWSIVMPLTALSAYLLLSKPRSPKPGTVSES